jgi:hypothetical protein
MGHLLFDTDSMRSTGGDLAGTARDLVERIPALVADASVVMPPATAAEVAEVVASVGRTLATSSAFYGSSAVDVVTRAALVEAENAATGIGARLGSFTTSLWRSGMLGLRAAQTGVPSAFPALERIRGALDTIDGDVVTWMFEEGQGSLETMIYAVKNTPRLAAEFGDEARNLEDWSVFKGMSAVGKGLGVLDATMGTLNAWDRSSEETLVGRGFTTATTAAEAYEFATNPVLAGANAIDGGSLQTDANIITDMGGAAISGAQHGFDAAVASDQRDLADGNYVGLVVHGVSGAASGALHGANETLNADANYAAQGGYGPFVQGVSKVVDWTIDKSYAPVSNVVGHVGGAVSSSANAAEHLAGSVTHEASQVTGRGIKDLESLL